MMGDTRVHIVKKLFHHRLHQAVFNIYADLIKLPNSMQDLFEFFAFMRPLTLQASNSKLEKILFDDACVSLFFQYLL